MPPKHGIGVRQPYQSEIDWFFKNRDIPGMATEDNMVIINPYVDFTQKPWSEEKKKALIKLETSRAYMKKFNIRPKFNITPEQMKYFSTIRNNKPYGSEQDIRETIASRIIVEDPTAGSVTPEQQIFSTLLERLLNE